MGYYLISVAIFMAWAFYCQFPLVSSDSGTYISSGFKLTVPIDRSITYGLFSRVASINSWMWMLAGVQALIQSFVLRQAALYVFNFRGPNTYLLFINALLCYATPVGTFVAQVSPDMFTAIAFLCTLLLWYGEAGIPRKTIWAFLLLLSLTLHNSNLLIFLVFNLLLLLANYFWVIYKWRRLVVTLAISMGSFAVVSLVNYSIDGNASISRGSYVFVMGKLAETSILTRYLKHDCGRNQYTICNYKESIPENFNAYLWDGNSPLYKMGGWEGSKTESEQIIKEVMKTPDYWRLYLKLSLEETFIQLFHYKAGDGIYPQGQNSVYWNMREHYADDLAQYQRGAQQINQPLFDALNERQNTVLVISLIAIFLALSFMSLGQRKMVLVLALFLLTNSFICTFFSTVADRFAARLVWLIPFFAILILPNHLYNIKCAIRRWFDQSKPIKNTSE